MIVIRNYAPRNMLYALRSMFTPTRDDCNLIKTGSKIGTSSLKCHETFAIAVVERRRYYTRVTIVVI